MPLDVILDHIGDAIGIYTYTHDVHQLVITKF